MDIYQKIKRDHEVHRELMDRISATTGESEERKELFEKLLVDVEAHAAAEEQTLYSELIETVEAQSQTRHSIAEHEDTSELLDELQKTDMSSPAWLATFKKFRHELEHHMTEEERDVFPVGEELIGDKKASELGEKFENRKEIEEEQMDS